MGILVHCYILIIEHLIEPHLSSSNFQHYSECIPQYITAIYYRPFFRKDVSGSNLKSSYEVKRVDRFFYLMYISVSNISRLFGTIWSKGKLAITFLVSMFLL